VDLEFIVRFSEVGGWRPRSTVMLGLLLLLNWQSSKSCAANVAGKWFPT